MDKQSDELTRSNRQLQREIAERKRAEHALRRRNRELAMLHRASQAFSSTLDLDQVLVIALEEVRRLLGVVACSVWLTEQESGELVCRQATGPKSETVRGWRLAPGRGLVGWVAQRGESLVIPDALVDERHFRGVGRETGLALRSILTVPLRVKGGVIGALQTLDTEADRFGARDQELLESLAASVAIAIENARLYEQAQQEIIERIHAERALRESDEKFSNIIESIPMGMHMYQLATGGRLVFTGANPAADEILGVDNDRFVGKTIEEAFPSLAGTEIPDRYRMAASSGEVWQDDQVLYEEGQTQRVFEVHAFQTSPGRMVATFLDVTNRRQAEAEIQRHNKELVALNAIANTLSQPLDLGHALGAALDRILEVVEADAGWMQLLDEETGVLAVVAHRGLSQETVTVMQTIRSGEGIAGRVAQSGQPIVVDRLSGDFQLHIEGLDQEDLHTFVGIPVKAKDRVLGVLGVCSRSPRAVSSQEMHLLSAIAHQVGVAVENARLAEEASEIEILRELNRLRSELVANVSHELRTPLGLIKFFVTSLLMEDADFDRETELRFLHGIDEEADRLEVTVDNLLDLSRVEGGRLLLDRQFTDVGRLAEDVLASVRTELGLDGQPVHYSLVHNFPSEPLVAPVDARRIEQVLRNLLHNAIKYSPDGGTIAVQGRGDESQLLVWVTDQGVGIPAQDLERIFERFYRVENEVTQRTRGAGLGLAVCRGVVEAHGGRIWVESTPGEGSTFYFTLPVDDDLQPG